MARSLSSQKRLRQSKAHSAQNRVRKSQIKTAIRKVHDAIHQRDLPTAEQTLIEATKQLDRNANRNTIHPNAASRRKSRLAKRINALRVQAK